MILNLEDWKKYPEAIVDVKTKNQSFIRVSLLFKKMGIKNHAFPLALLDPSLQGIDPFDPDLTPEQMTAIAIECKRNVWYFLREIIRIPVSGVSTGSEFLANRANIAYAWCYFKHITSINIQPRQTGKSINNDAISVWLLCFGGENVTITLYTKSHGLRVINIERLKEIFELLPWYLNPRTKKDSNNQENITVNAYGNIYTTLIGQSTLQAANNVGRGNTSENIIVDELGHIPNVDISLPVLTASANAARENAERIGTNYCTMYTTTPGYLSTKPGIFAKAMYDDCARWTEKYYDATSDEELREMIKKNSPAGKVQVLLEFNHRQLGKTDEWLKNRIRESQAQDIEVIEAEYLNKWAAGSSSSPFTKEILERFIESQVDPEYEEISENGYITYWYVPEHVVENHFNNRSIVLGMDTSEAVGRDAITLNFMDVSTGEVIGTGVYNMLNTVEFANFISNILIKHKNITLMPEHKSTFSSILDVLFIMLPKRNEDPFKRIFNTVVNECHENKEYKDCIKEGINRDPYSYTKYKTKFGYRTSGSGEFSRNALYGNTLSQSSKYLSHLVHDKTLIQELSALVVKNGRVDHTAKGHDDTVIAWLLSCWFLYNARNKSLYNIDEDKVLNIIKLNSSSKSPEETAKMNRQSLIREEIDKYIELAKKSDDELIRKRYINRIKILYEDINIEYGNVLSFEELMKQLNLEKHTSKYNFK